MWHFFVERLDFQRRVRAFGRRDHEDGSALSVQPLVCQRLAPGEVDGPDPIEPFLEGRDALPMLQALVDACWEAGIKPSGHDDFRRVNDAQAKHLDDMRVIVAKSLDVDLRR